MSAFGRRNGTGNASGGRPNFGVAKPMKGPVLPAAGEGGDQFPPIEPDALPGEEEEREAEEANKSWLGKLDGWED